jgi:hypothetical protein
MSILNSYVCLEASMVERYCTKEVIEFGGPFSNSVLKDQVATGLLPSRHEDRLHRSGRTGHKPFILLD